MIPPLFDFAFGWGSNAIGKTGAGSELFIVVLVHSPP